MLECAELINETWMLVNKNRIDHYFLDQKTWTEEEATEKGLYSDTIKPFTPKPTPGVGWKLGIATVVDGRVVWPVVSKSAEELAADELAAKTEELAACQCFMNGTCMMMEVVDWNINNGTPPRSELSVEFLQMHDNIKTLQSDIDGAA